MESPKKSELQRSEKSSNSNNTNGASASTTNNTATISTNTTTITANSAVPLPTSYAIKEKRNWQIHLLYIRQSFEECLKLIELQLKDCNGLCEYPLFIKALIKRSYGQVEESLSLFRAAAYLNPQNLTILKQIGRSQLLLGKHQDALHTFEEVRQLSEDWEAWYHKGLCYVYLKDSNQAIECFKKANRINKHDCTFLQLSKQYVLRNDFKAAIEVLQEALEYSPENPELLTAAGVLYLRTGENYRAFDYFGNALIHDPRNSKTILAAGSIIQDSDSEVEVALMKYRTAIAANPNSAQLWNNVGMCFFGKQKYVMAISALKKALYLAPFEWLILFNLGASINLKPDFASSYMYLGIVLDRLDDTENSSSAYKKALELEKDFVFELNYAITLFNRNKKKKAAKHYANFKALFEQLDEETKNLDTNILEQSNLLAAALQSLQQQPS